MIVSEDGTVTGSIDVSKLDSVKPKTDEAKAQLAALKADLQAGREQAEADAQRFNEAAAAANPLIEEASPDNRDAQGKSVAPAEDAPAEQPKAQHRPPARGKEG